MFHSQRCSKHSLKIVSLDHSPAESNIPLAVPELTIDMPFVYIVPVPSTTPLPAAVPQPSMVFETTSVLYEADDVVEGVAVIIVSVDCVVPLVRVIVVLDTTIIT